MKGFPPRDIPVVLLVTANKIETCELLAAVPSHSGQSPKLCSANHGAYYDLGMIAGARILNLKLADLGSSKEGGSTLTLLDFADEVSPMAIIAVGVACGLMPKKQELGDVLVSDAVQTVDQRRIGTDPAGQPVEVWRGNKVSAPSRLRTFFQAVTDLQVHHGIILSGEALIDNSEEVQRLRNCFPEAIGYEMEGTGLIAVAGQRRIDWLIVKGICDWGENKGTNKSNRQKRAARNAIKLLLNVLTKGPFSRREHSESNFPPELRADAIGLSPEALSRVTGLQDESTLTGFASASWLLTAVRPVTLITVDISPKVKGLYCGFNLGKGHTLQLGGAHLELEGDMATLKQPIELTPGLPRRMQSTFHCYPPSRLEKSVLAEMELEVRLCFVEHGMHDVVETISWFSFSCGMALTRRDRPVEVPLVSDRELNDLFARGSLAREDLDSLLKLRPSLRYYAIHSDDPSHWGVHESVILRLRSALGW